MRFKIAVSVFVVALAICAMAFVAVATERVAGKVQANPPRDKEETETSFQVEIYLSGFALRQVDELDAKGKVKNKATTDKPVENDFVITLEEDDSGSKTAQSVNIIFGEKVKKATFRLHLTGKSKAKGVLTLSVIDRQGQRHSEWTDSHGKKVKELKIALAKGVGRAKIAVDTVKPAVKLVDYKGGTR